MKLKFLETVPSNNAEYPFLAGQIIAIPKLTAFFRRYVERGQARVLPEPEEAAVLEAEEVAVESRPKGRGTR